MNEKNETVDFSEALEAYQKHMERFADLDKALDDAKEKMIQQKLTADAACTAYLEDLEQQKQNLTAAAEDYDRQLAELDKLLESLSSQLISAAGKRDEKKTSSIRERITAGEARRASLLRQKELLSGDRAHGDEELFRRAEAEERKYEESVAELVQALEPVFEIFDDESEQIKKFKAKLRIRHQGMTDHWIYDDSSLDNSDLWECVRKRHDALNKPAPAAASGSRFTVSQTSLESEMDSPGISQKWLS